MRHYLIDIGHDGIDVVDCHLSIIVHVSTALIDVRSSQNDADDTVHIDDVHLAITVHVSIGQIKLPSQIAGIA